VQRLRFAGAACAVSAACVLALAHGGASTPSAPLVAGVTVSPALFPAYAPSVHDYVVRCSADKPVHVTVAAAAGADVLVNGVARRSAAIPLHPGEAFTIDGARGGVTADYHVRCLPADFPQFTETRLGRTPYLYLLAPALKLVGKNGRYVAIFDGNGVPVWWYRASKPPIDAKLLPGPLIAYAAFPVDSHAAYELRSLDGKLVRTIGAPPGQLIDDHELQLRANGDVAYLVYRPLQHVDLTQLGGPADATVLETDIDEAAPNGKVVWSWTSEGAVGLDEAARWAKAIVGKPIPLPKGGTGYDVFHANAISLAGSTVVLSMRQTDAVYGIDRTSGRIIWKLGGTHTPASLTVVGDPDAAAPLGGQHDARLLPDGTLTVFDDGSLLGRAPRAVRYRIDPVAHTATFIGAVTDPGVTSPICCGSTRLLGDGNWLVSWGNNPVVGEYEPNGTPVFRISFADDVFSYRAVPIAASELPVAALRQGMDAMATR
jgi:Arylsulfotransferase (ASST)